MKRIINRALLVAGVLVALPLATQHEAKALTLGAAISDNFDANPTNWSPWYSANAGANFIVNDANALSPNNDFALVINNGSSSSFALIERVFSWTTNPTKTPVKCVGSVYLRTFGGVARGALQFIDANSWTYIASQSFNIPAATGWTPVTVTGTSACTRDLDVRIVLDGSLSGFQGALVDNVSVRWYY